MSEKINGVEQAVEATQVGATQVGTAEESGKVFKAHGVLNSTGFNMIVVSSFLSLGCVALLALGLINNNPKGAAVPFNWVGSLVALAIIFMFWLVLLVVVAYLMRNTPRRIELTKEQLRVNNSNGIEIEIQLDTILAVRRTSIPVSYGKLPASFPGLIIRYRAASNSSNQQEQSLTLSSRDTANFEELSQRLLALHPKSKRLET